jgi:hypothetical protein
MTPEQEYFRTILAEAAKRAQQEAQQRVYELQDYERRQGFHRPSLNPERAYTEVTGRDTYAGAKKYTRRNAEDIHD